MSHRQQQQWQSCRQVSLTHARGWLSAAGVAGIARAGVAIGLVGAVAVDAGVGDALVDVWQHTNTRTQQPE